MKLNAAQKLILEICDGGNSHRDYKAPHAYRPTPPRPKTGGPKRKKLFKGHRP